MKRKKGYLLLENIINIVTILVLITILYYLLLFTYNAKTNLEDKVELQQQSNEMVKYIDDVIGKSKGIIGFKLDESDNKQENNFISVISIKCRYRDTPNDNSIKDKEISLKQDNNKLFINTLSSNGNSESGGYEIGDYIDKMYICKNNNEQLIDIKLELSKNEVEFKSEFSVSIKNFEGDNI